MKKIYLLIYCLLVIVQNVFPQNVGVGTILPAGKLHVKGSANNSQLVIDANSTQANTFPLIKLRNSLGSDLLWIHADDTSNVFIGLHAGRANDLLNGQGTFNTFIGSNTGFSNTSGPFNTAFGSRALYSNQFGGYNTASGTDALYANAGGDYNTAFGMNALYSNVRLSGGTAIGYNAMKNANNTTETDFNFSVAVGFEALRGSSNASANTGNANTALGSRSLRNNTSGYSNTASGTDALFNNTTGGRNTAIGYSTLVDNREGLNNTATGSQALYANTTGSNNTAIGAESLYSILTGNDNTTIGYKATVSGDEISNATAIGSHSYAGASNSVVIGSINGVNGATENSNVGIGTTTPNPKAILEIKSTTQGVLFPMLTSAQRNTISVPPHGLHVFNIEERCLNYYDFIYQVWNCYCDECKTVIININQSACKIDFYEAYAKSNPASKYVINIPAGVTISGCNPGDTALTFINMTVNANITIHNHGTIEGSGGSGGNGTIETGCIPVTSPAVNGKKGGNAVATKPGITIIINNYGIVAGGGGGGGGSGANPSGYGGGGGGGAGILGGAGGPGGGDSHFSGGPVSVCLIYPNIGSPGMSGTATAGGAGGAGNTGGAPGGNGGNRGQAGNNGSGNLGAPGGLAGKAIGGGSGNIISNLAGGQSFGLID
ncbi:MAG TPA: hypothetical protein VFG10_09095 [Saprospiraceae bacterium]|nr:hypothetical protein [Saprospiraceae bacterium]